MSHDETTDPTTDTSGTTATNGRPSRRAMLGLGLGTATIGALMSGQRTSAAVEYMRLDITNSRMFPTGIVNSVGDAFVATTAASATALTGNATNISGGTGVAGTGETAGVTGTSATGAGVKASSDSGTGLSAMSQSGVGISVFSASGTALAVEGRVLLSRSGVAVVPADKDVVVVDVPGGVTATAFALATLQKHRQGVQVLSATPNRRTGTLTIRLNEAVGAATKVGWLVLS